MQSPASGLAHPAIANINQWNTSGYRANYPELCFLLLDTHEACAYLQKTKLGLGQTTTCYGEIERIGLQ